MNPRSTTLEYLVQLSQFHSCSVRSSVDTSPYPFWRKPSHVSAKRSGGDGCDSGDGVDADGDVSLRFPLRVGERGRLSYYRYHFGSFQCSNSSAG